MTYRVLGLDGSLTSFGVASAPSGTTHAIRVKKMPTLDRIHAIGRELKDNWYGGVDLAVMEGPSLRSVNGLQHERAGLWWMIRDSLWSWGIPCAIVAPRSRALYGAGNGGYNKREVLAAAPAWFPGFDYRHRPGRGDELDALILAAMGADHLNEPLVSVPASHRRALDKCVWPDLPGPVGGAVAREMALPIDLTGSAP